MNGSGSVPSSTSGQQLASAIPSPTAGKTWRSKSMNMKHSATSSMLATKPPSPTASPTPPCSSDRLRPPITDASKSAPGNQRSMLEKFRLINPRSASRTSPSVAEMALQEEDDLSECGDEGTCSPTPPCGISKQQGKTSVPSFAPPNKNAAKNHNNKSLPQPKDKEDKSKTKSKASTPPKEEPVIVDPTKKSSKIASLIPKGGKTSASMKKESAIPASSGIPKPGLKAPTATTKPAVTQPSVPAASVPVAAGDKTKLSKSGQSMYMQRSLGGLENRKTSMVSSTSTSALSGSVASHGLGGGGALAGNGVVQLPQQQQHNHPNTATVAPFMYR